MNKFIKTALVSVYNKDGLEKIIKLLDSHKVKIISTGGTADFIKSLSVPVTTVEEITNFPSVFGGRVKTLQPQIFGGILNRRDNADDQKEKEKYKIEDIDLVIVDLYPFEETLASGAKDEEIIEKIDIGGISLIRAGAKNFNDVVIVPSKNQYAYIAEILKRDNKTTIEERKYLAGCAFKVTSQYDSAIRGYFEGNILRYGENPHQSGMFIGNISDSWKQLHGKEMSYNNFLDTEAAINLVYDFTEPAFAIIKHMNACGFAIDSDISVAFQRAYDGDPVSAFGGILASNRPITKEITEKVRDVKLFVEVIIAPDFEKDAYEILEQKKDIRILKWKNPKLPMQQHRTCLTGILVQDRDTKVEKEEELKCVTKRPPSKEETSDMLTANIIVKHLKSNSVAIVKNAQLLTMGCGQTSRIDALKQSLEKAKNFGFDVRGAVVASEAFLPFNDCVEVAGNAGIKAVIQPGGSKGDQSSIDKCDELDMAMVFTGVRHFKH
jgi:phosphoribosylaminoimidazolecarboxamide formyltransferase / IMP cyclohydrolase